MRKRIRDATSALVHRGPDQQGVFESACVSLGATRLKILDLASGDQPILSEDGDTVIVFNGEIYNHLELRRELQQLGHRFRSNCDTETVLHAFLEWDIQCFARLRGMFAVALWTESARRLVLARDRMGIKPLYIAQRAQELFFGSELKSIFVHPQIERRLSMAGLDCYLSLNYVPCPWTLIEGITKLPPGHWLEWRNGAVRSEPYWQLPARRKAGQVHTGGRQGGTRFAVAAVGSRASARGCPAGSVAQRRHRFLDHRALCRGRMRLAPQDFFHLVSGTQLRRNHLHSPSGGQVRNRAR